MIISVLITLSIFGFMNGDEVLQSLKCNKCYMKHYEVRGCTPVYEKGSDCPVRFDCPEKKKDNPSVCFYKEKTFKEGEDIDVGDLCQNCKCRQSFARDGVDVICFPTECPNDLGVSLNASCYWAYKEEKCCPQPLCPTDEGNQKKACEYGGKTYRYGKEIYPGNSKKCICNEKWSGVNGSSCKTISCLMLDLNQKKLQDGCIPVYFEEKCCPINMFCGKERNNLRNSSISLAKKEDIDSGNTCIFNDTHYKIGQNLNHLYDRCITCSCVTPPDFTCIRRKCHRPPNYDYKNCKSKYTPGKCCPSYNCTP